MSSCFYASWQMSGSVEKSFEQLSGKCVEIILGAAEPASGVNNMWFINQPVTELWQLLTLGVLRAWLDVKLSAITHND